MSNLAEGCKAHPFRTVRGSLPQNFWCDRSSSIEPLIQRKQSLMTRDESILCPLAPRFALAIYLNLRKWC